MQYVDELPDAAYELRVYPGTDGCFELYDDEGDNYNYERGAYAWTGISWNEQKNTLTFFERTGSFDTLIEERDYALVVVREGHGTGLEPTTDSDGLIRYAGHMMSKEF